ncbi:MAG: hypothetical protein AB7T49_14790 [Oligoflexales bacterium]
MSCKTNAVVEVLANKGILHDDIIACLDRFIDKWSVRPIEAVLDCHVISEQALADLLSNELGYQRIHTITKDSFSSSAFNAVSYTEALDWQVLPFGKDAAGMAYHVVMVDPTQKNVITEIERRVELPVAVAVSEKRRIVQAINEFYPVELQISSLVHASE